MSTPPLSKTAAIRAARSSVGLPIRRSSTNYVIYGPYRSNDPKGQSTEATANSYPMALARRTRWCADVALSLMGYISDEAAEAVYMASQDGGSVETIVGAALAELTKGAQEMKTYEIRVIDGLPNQGGSEWPDMARTIKAQTLAQALDTIEAEIDQRPPRASDYGVDVGEEITITIQATGEGADRGNRVIRYEAA